MTLADIQSKMARWHDRQEGALAAFLAVLRLKWSDHEKAVLSHCLDDKRPESWVSLGGLKAKLAAAQ